MDTAGYDFDLVVIGSGPAGEKAAAKAAYFGKRVALIEREPDLGGVCGRGGLPSKILRQSALTYVAAKQRLPGVLPPTAMATLLAGIDPVCDARILRVRDNLQRHGVTVLRGAATFADTHTVTIDGAGRSISGAVILIAAGSRPHRPASIPFDDRRVFCSESILRARDLPRSLIVVGGGVIGSEYASIFAALGVDVHLFENRERIVEFLDREIGACLQQEMARLGVTLHLGETVTACRVVDDAVEILGSHGASTRCEALLFSGGRDANTDGLGLEAIGVATGRGGRVTVDAVYRTTVPHVYAAGDVIGFPALASTSMEQGRVAIGHAFGLDDTRHTEGEPSYPEAAVYPLLPHGIYTIPAVSTVGRTEEQVLASGRPALVGRARYADHDRGRMLGDETGLLKLVCDRETLAVLGVHILGASAEELIHVGQACMHFGGTLEYFLRAVFNFPTLGALYKTAAYDALTQRDRT